MYILVMGSRITISEAPKTRLGRLLLAGEVDDADPSNPHPLRVIDAYVLSVVLHGHGHYRYDGGRHEPIHPGTVTIVHPGVPHWYGTLRGQRWTELFAVFTGPLFDTLGAVGVLPPSGPHRPRAKPAAARLRALLHGPPRSQLAAEHQLLAIADWILDVNRPIDSPYSSAIAAGVELLAADLSGELCMRAVAARVGQPYDTFRHRFVAEVGQSPLAFRNDRRLEAAATMLRMTDLTVRAIARTLGYTDEFHLSRRFRARFGCPPGIYRTGTHHGR